MLKVMKQQYLKEHALFIGQKCSYGDSLILKIWTSQLVHIVLLMNNFWPVMTQKDNVLSMYQSFLSRIGADSLHSCGSMDLRVKL